MTTYSENCSRSLAGESVGALDTLFENLCIWTKNRLLRMRIHRERRQLLSMSEAMLKDLGITRTAAECEARRTDLPATRMVNG